MPPLRRLPVFFTHMLNLGGPRGGVKIQELVRLLYWLQGVIGLSRFIIDSLGFFLTSAEPSACVNGQSKLATEA